MIERADGVAVLVLCFAGRGTSSKARKTIGRQIQAGGGGIFDEAILRVDAKGKASVYDPRRTVAGALTPALTWGAFGALTGGGLVGLIGGAIVGGVLGGLCGYYLEHSLTKDELARVGRQMPPDSSAFAGFIRTTDAAASLRSLATVTPTTATIAQIRPDLSARVWSGAEDPIETPTADTDPPGPDAAALVSMVVVRYHGQQAIRDVMSKKAIGTTVEPELLFEADQQGRKRVSSPTSGVAVTAKSSSPWWAAFGLVFGVVAGWTGGGGVFGALEDGLVTAIAWGLFGLVAGGLYGLWAGRAISAGRLQRFSAVLPPNTSAMMAWSDGAVTDQTISDLLRPDAGSVVLRFRAAGSGVAIEAQATPVTIGRAPG